MMDKAAAREVVEAWAEDVSNPLYGWDTNVQDLVSDAVGWMNGESVEPEDVMDAVRDMLNSVDESPECAGVSFPIYNCDVDEVWQSNTEQCEDALSELGGLAELGHESLGEAISTAVWYAVDTAAREQANELMDRLDELEEQILPDED